MKCLLILFSLAVLPQACGQTCSWCQPTFVYFCDTDCSCLLQRSCGKGICTNPMPGCRIVNCYIWEACPYRNPRYTWIEITSFRCVQWECPDVITCFGSCYYSVDKGSGMLTRISNVPGIDCTSSQCRGTTSMVLRSAFITSLWPKVFEVLPELTDLDLSSNLISFPSPSQTFSGLLSLQRLRLDNNRISYLPADLFKNLPSLANLDLSSNLIDSSLPADLFKNLSSLTDLNLSSNRIVNLPGDIFRGLVSMRTLHLHNNQIYDLPVDIFQGLVSVQTL